MSEGESGECIDFFYPFKHLQGVADAMRCSVQEVLRTATEDPETFESVLLIVRAENIVEAQLRRERSRG